MTTTKNDKPLLLRFSQPGGHLAAKRSTLQECARLLGVTETRAAHIAINKLWLSLKGIDETEFDFPENLPEYQATPGERADTKKALNALFEQAQVDAGTKS